MTLNCKQSGNKILIHQSNEQGQINDKHPGIFREVIIKNNENRNELL